ncbi:MAG: endonuclease/exonuclease/phosphatase family protein [Elusimicrobiales bacterium]|nr:endonuclease/exonuclease/phosphatase family protein [Elusimicrobiales bacterium]
MSFNIQGHGPGSSLHRAGNKYWEDSIIGIVRQSGADIVLLQEIPLTSPHGNLASSFANKLTSITGHAWKSADSASYSLSSMELNNAVLYNDEKVSLIEDLARRIPFYMYQHKINNKKRKYNFIKNNEQILKFALKEDVSNFFYLVNVHLPGPNDNEGQLSKEMREIEKLYADYKRNLPMIIGGDFNTRRIDLIRGSNFSDGIIDGNDGQYSDFWGQKTTISSPNLNVVQLANDYDHFIINKNYLFEISERMRPVFSKGKAENFANIKINNKIYRNSEEYKEISDHIPIIIKLDFKNVNDKPTGFLKKIKNLFNRSL